MKIGGEGDPRAIQKKHWELFAGEVGIKPRLVLTRVADLAKRIEDSACNSSKAPLPPTSVMPCTA